MSTDIYIVHRYDGCTFIMTLQEIYKQFKYYGIRDKFGYGTDFGRYISDYSWSDNYNFTFSSPDSTLRVYYQYLYFVTTIKGKLVNPNQIISEYFIKYEPNNRIYTGNFTRYRRSHRKRKNCRVYRAMKTTAERKAVKAVLKDEGEPEFRGRRRNIPNKWDDYWLYYDRSWKSQTKRKRQYKGS